MEVSAVCCYWIAWLSISFFLLDRQTKPPYNREIVIILLRLPFHALILRGVFVHESIVSMPCRLLEERDITLYCDLHGHSRKQNVFIYGCENRFDPLKRLRERVFPVMISKNAPTQVILDVKGNFYMLSSPLW